MSADSPKAQGSTGADRWGRVRRGLLMLMLMLVSSLPATTLLARPVQAQTPVVVPDENWTEMGLVGAMYELLLLIELDAFESTPAIDRMRDEVGFDHMTRDELIEELILVDDDNDLLLSLLPDREWEWISDEVDLTLGVIPDPLFNLIENGQREFLDPGQWLDAIADLARRRGGPPLPMRDRDRVLVMDVLLSLDSDGEIDLGLWTEPRVLQLEAEQTAPPTTNPPTTVTPATVATTGPPATIVEERVTSTTAAVTTAPAGLPAADGQPAPADSGSALPLVLAGAAALVVLALVGAMALRRRGGERPTGAASAAADVGAMLDISRRMTSALDADQVRSIAVDESNRLTGADAAAYIAKTEGGAEVAVASAAGVFSPSLIRGGVVGRVLEAGQKVIEVVAADPLLGSGGGAVASVAVIANGGVEGALVVFRDASSPFGSQELHALEALAPMVGAALQAAEAHRTAVTAADVDGLTQLRNRRSLDTDMGLVSGSGVCFAMIDVDHFKRFNDTFGHRAGDRALQAVARAIEINVRSSDVVYRYGGEEFSVLLHDCDLEAAAEVLERVREAVAQTPIPLSDGSVQHVTVSVGVAAYPGDPEGVEALAAAADSALYEAKEGGRDRVVSAAL